MEQPSSPRRKLLSGSLAAPVVLTVASPSALARTSFLACIERGKDQQLNAQPFLSLRSPDDGMYREKVAVYSLKDTRTNATLNGLFWKDQSGDFRSIDACNASAVSQLTVSATGAGDRLALVYFDLNGKKTGIGCYPNGGFPVSRSCWGSFVAHKG